MEPEERHFYEIIKEGTPCKLYFDLEFQTELNPKADGDKMVQILKYLVLRQLAFDHDLSGLDEKMIIDLSSTTEKKFSRHLIFNIPDVVFQNNLHAGIFLLESMT